MEDNNTPQNLNIVPPTFVDREYSIDEIKGYIQDTKLPSRLPSVVKPSDQGIQDIRQDVPLTAVYNKLSDGTYIPKYENYAGAFGNEDRLAKSDRDWEKYPV